MRTRAVMLLLVGLSGCLSLPVARLEQPPDQIASSSASGGKGGWAVDQQVTRGGSTSAGQPSAGSAEVVTHRGASPDVPSGNSERVPGQTWSLMPVLSSGQLASPRPASVPPGEAVGLAQGGDSRSPTGAGEQEGVHELVLRGSHKVDPLQPDTPVLPGTAQPLVQGAEVRNAPLGDSGASGPAPPMVRIVNSKRIHFRFEVKQVGTSGVAGVEVWCTRDGRDWKKCQAPEASKTYTVEVDQEGMYGFTLLARSGTGVGKQPPQLGDQPQVWVIVDETPPVVAITEAKIQENSKPRRLEIRWQASDRNLKPNSIMLLYAEREAGPWKTITDALGNTGHYVWQVPPDLPEGILLRVEAADLAGNIGRAQTRHPIVPEQRVPEVVIEEVESESPRQPGAVPSR